MKQHKDSWVKQVENFIDRAFPSLVTVGAIIIVVIAVSSCTVMMPVPF